MQKINFQDLPSTTTPINASNLNQVQTNVEDAIDDINININYSTTEQVIGTWIDGKPLYRKSFFKDVNPSGTQNTWINTNISVDTCVKLYGFLSNGTETIMLPSAYSTSYYDALVYDYNNPPYINAIRVHLTSGRSNYSGYITMEYTKTTD